MTVESHNTYGDGITVDEFVQELWEHGILGLANAVQRDELAARIGISGRALRAVCEEARLAGHFVAYSTKAPGGIYLCGSDAERDALMRQITDSCLHRLKQRGALRRALHNRGQLQLSTPPPDGCQFCKGSRGGVRGNENVINGKLICDYCHADSLAD